MNASGIVLDSISKTYGRVAALSNVTMQFRMGEVVGLIGQNGAGKSTLLKILSGGERPDSGRVLIDDVAVALDGAAGAARYGIGMVHQEQSLVPNWTVAENVFLGRRSRAIRGGLIRWGVLHRECARLLDRLDCDFAPSAITGELTFGQRQMVELVRALSFGTGRPGGATVLLDEPTSLLSEGEVSRLFGEVRAIKEQSAVVFVSHRLEEVLEISDRVYVMSEGRCVGNLRVDECDHDLLYRLMVGKEKSSDFYSATNRRVVMTRQSAVLSTKLATRTREFANVSLDLMPGSIVGLAGIVGSGREEFVRSIFGLLPLDSGSVSIDGRPLTIASPSDASRHGIGYVPAERKVEGAVMGQSIARNMCYQASDQISRGGIVLRSRQDSVVEGWATALQIKMASPGDDIASLSGGNQQKAVLAKWLAKSNLRVLILDHPTRGLDLGAKADVYAYIRDAAERGVAVLLLSDTLDELVGLSDEILTMRDGEITARFRDVPTSPPAFDALLKEMV